MKISFLLPGSSPYPSGGVKILYEHANRLAQRGHSVTLVHGAFVRRGNFGQRLRGIASYLLNAAGVMHWRPDRWFAVDNRIVMKWVPSLASRWVPDGDAVVASAWQTAEWAATYPPAKGRKFYFIQDYERFMEAGPGLRKRIADTYSNGLTNIVISPSCRETVEANGGKVCCEVPNGLDFRNLELKVAIDHPSRCRIGFPSRPEGLKATGHAVKALETVRVAFGESLEIWSFGGRRPACVPDWVNYHERPSDGELQDLYNRTAVFVVPSLYEGWGLPGSEAMACGAALVSTDNGGVSAYADHGKTALVSPAGDPGALAENVICLLNDRDRRIGLAEEGARTIREFTWDRAADAMESCLVKFGSPPGMDRQSTDVRQDEMLKKLLSGIPLRLIDRVIAPCLYPAALIFRSIRKNGVHRMPACRELFMRVGVFPVRDHYYEPLFNPARLNKSLAEDRCLPGIDMNPQRQLAMLELFNFNEELMSFPLDKPEDHGFYYCNGSFGPGDAEYLYNIVRTVKPRKIIEIGSGYSTLTALGAVERNIIDDAGYSCELVCIEPYENEWLEKTSAKIIRKRVEEMDKEVFRGLSANDILFIDSSHVIRPQGDVLFEYQEILPILNRGVLVHIHDIHTPKDYPAQWLSEEVRLWNEQYLLEAFLAFNSEYSVVGALNYLSHHFPEQLYEKCPVLKSLPDSLPGSFWIVRN